MAIERKSLREQVRDEIVNRITSGQLKPGDKIILLQLSEEIGVSYVTVREAIYELIGLGILESSHHKGAKVREIGLEETIANFEVRAALERFAALKAANAFRGNVDFLRKIIVSMREATDRYDSFEFKKWNHLFHRSIVEAAQNPLLLNIWESLAMGIRARCSTNRYLDREIVLESIQDHQEIVDALDRGDGEESSTRMFEHSMRLVELFEKEIRAGELKKEIA